MDVLQVFRRHSPVSVLGPGQRAVLWVQGCEHHCSGCITPEAWDPAGGRAVPVAQLAQWALAQPGIDGLTISGGEPFLQAGALAALIDTVQAAVNLGVVCYSGYTYEELQARGDMDTVALLERIDLLIDGPYLAEQHEDLLWRGSANQRLLALTNRYRACVSAIDAAADRSAGLEFQLDDSGLFFNGVPAAAGFRADFEQRLGRLGIRLGIGEGTV